MKLNRLAGIHIFLKKKLNLNHKMQVEHLLVRKKHRKIAKLKKYGILMIKIILIELINHRWA